MMYFKHNTKELNSFLVMNYGVLYDDVVIVMKNVEVQV